MHDKLGFWCCQHGLISHFLFVMKRMFHLIIIYIKAIGNPVLERATLALSNLTVPHKGSHGPHMASQLI